MLRQFNALKNSNFKLSDFCTNDEIEKLRNYLNSNGFPYDWVPLTHWGEPGPKEDRDRRDFENQVIVFEGQVLNEDIRRANGENYSTENLAMDLVFTNYRIDNERF